MASTALVLAGHGSHISPNTAGVVWQYVDQLRAWGVADEVTACFWKESPPYSSILNTLTADEIVIVPVFTARGFFSNRVIPTEMQIQQQTTRRIHYTAPLGEHPALQDVVGQQVRDALATYHLDTAQTTVAIVGHGTPRSQRSQQTVRDQVANLKAQHLVADVIPAYLDDAPDIPSIFARANTPHIIVLPYFLAAGSHTTIDVPNALGLEQPVARATLQNRDVIYLPPLSNSADLCDLIRDLARESGIAFEKQAAVTAWAGFPQHGAAALIQAVAQAGTLDIGQLRLTQERVEPLTTHHTDKPQAMTSPAALRDLVRQPDPDTYRPLATSDNLPGGWYVAIDAPHMLPAVLETVYPGVLADWADQRAGTFTALTLEDVIGRQVGFFKDVSSAEADVQPHVTAICGRCCRHATWHDGVETDLPCREPCNVWLSAAHKRHEEVDA